MDHHKKNLIFFINCKVTCSKLNTNKKCCLHVQSIQTSKVNNFYFFQTFFFLNKCGPFLLKIGKDFNIDDYKGKRTWIDKKWFITNLSTFGSNMFLTLKFMDFEIVALTKLFIFIWYRAQMHNIYDIKSNFSQNIFISNMQCQIKYPKYKILSYKPTCKWDMSCAILGKWLLPLCPWLLLPCSHPLGINTNF